MNGELDPKRYNTQIKIDNELQRRKRIVKRSRSRAREKLVKEFRLKYFNRKVQWITSILSFGGLLLMADHLKGHKASYMDMNFAIIVVTLLLFFLSLYRLILCDD